MPEDVPTNILQIAGGVILALLIAVVSWVGVTVNANQVELARFSTLLIELKAAQADLLEITRKKHDRFEANHRDHTRQIEDLRERVIAIEVRSGMRDD